MLATIDAKEQVAVARRYFEALADFYGYNDYLLEIVNDDFPGADSSPAIVTRYHLDAMCGLRDQMIALVSCHEANPN